MGRSWRVRRTCAPISGRSNAAPSPGTASSNQEFANGRRPAADASTTDAPLRVSPFDGILNPVNGTAYVDSLNLGYDVRFDEHGRWEDPTFIAIKFFEIMVSAAAEQEMEWHMSLTYMRDFVKMLAERYDDSGEGVDQSREWPTRAAHLIDTAIGALLDWVAMAARLPAQSRHRALDNDRVDWENGNIPKTAAVSLGQCMQTVIMSDAIGERFKRDQL